MFWPFFAKAFVFMIVSVAVGQILSNIFSTGKER